ncbi:MAG: two-component regulator propeller domain-containing protein [Flavobacteriales bacterium]|nr:two-component regulator propeller domain-containing protein [Flavobacteriales bacterium]
MLTRFGGSTSYEYFPSVTDSLSYKGTLALGLPIEDDAGNIWFLTNEALNCYVRTRDGFDVYPLPEILANNIESGYVLPMKGGNMLLHDIRQGRMLELDVERKKFREIEIAEFENHVRNDLMPYRNDSIDKLQFGFIPVTDDDKLLTGVKLMVLYEDTIRIAFPGHPFKWVNFPKRENDSIAWFSSDRGLLRMNVRNKTWQVFPVGQENGRGIPFLLYRLRGCVYLTTDDLQIFDMRQQRLTSVQRHDDTAPYSITTTSRVNLPEDNTLVVEWSLTGGIDFYAFGKKKFHHYMDKAEAKRLGTDSFIRAMCEDGEGNIWLGMQNGNVLVLNSSKEIIARYKDVISEPHSSEYGYEHIMRDSRNRMLFSSWRGLTVFDPKSNKWSRVYMPGTTDGFSNSASRVLQLKDGRILALMAASGLAWIKEVEGKITLEQIRIEPLNRNSFFSHIFEDKLHRIYLSSTSKLFILEEDDSHNFETVSTINIGQAAKDFYEDPDEITLWIAPGSGLVKMNMTDFSYTIITEKDGLPNGTVYCV